MYDTAASAAPNGRRQVRTYLRLLRGVPGLASALDWSPPTPGATADAAAEALDMCVELCRQQVGGQFFELEVAEY